MNEDKSKHFIAELALFTSLIINDTLCDSNDILWSSQM